LNHLFQWWRRIGYWISDRRAQFGNAVRGVGSLASPRKVLPLALSALPLLLALWFLPVPPGSSWARLGERAAWQWSWLQDTPESYEWFYRHWASQAGQPAIAELIDAAAWSRAVRANTYDGYAVYISAYSAGGRHIVAALNAADDLLWAQADSLGTSASYNTYLEKFPQGRHAQEAQDDAEEIAWRQIAGGLTVDNLSEFIAEFQTGRHLAEAQNALGALRQKEGDAAAPTESAGAVTGSLGGNADELPVATNPFVAGERVPLPRARPHVLVADGDVPLPRPRPKSFAAAPQSTPNPLGWLQNLIQPGSVIRQDAH
jgi:hypothetical protein